LPLVELSYLLPRREEQREKMAKAITDAALDIFKVPKRRLGSSLVRCRQNHISKGGTLWNKR
jgi:hypothetical protein